MNRTKREIENLLMPPAGLSSHQDARGSTSDCMVFDERPHTPEEIRKYRRSANLEPGKRFQNPKTVMDLQTLQLEQKTFGISSKTSELNAASLLKQIPPNGTVGKLNFTKAENIYYTTKREPLGRVYSRHHQLPQKYLEGEPFGKSSSGQDETAKSLLFPKITEGQGYADEMYKKSHGTWGVGEQKTRGYDWKYDPKKTVFGMKGKDIAFNGVSKNIAEVLTSSNEENGPLVATVNVENFKDLGDTLGKPRNLGIGASSIPPDTVFGKPSIPVWEKDIWGASETIRGNYGDNNRDDGATVDDLGRSITPGFRNITTENRAYGVPSIRVDLPRLPANKRSMADPMNYGDDVSARELISPQDFSNLSITPQDFHKPLSLDKIRHIFEAIGCHLNQDISEFIYDLASQGQGGCSVHQYRVVMNDYLYAEETGNADDWLHANGYSRRK